MTEKRVMLKKMCVVGEAAVGKTSLIKRFVFDKFSDRYIATIGAKTSAKEVQISTDSEDILLQLQIWDIIGLRSFAKLQTRAYKGANGAFIVTDISRKGTLKTFELWLMELYKAAGEIPVVLIANKHDLTPDFGEDEIKKVLSDYDFPFFLTSAKTGENVEEAFASLGRLMIAPWEKRDILKKLGSIQYDMADMEPELEAGRPLSIFEVEDIIMARYCDLLDDPYFAMSLINEQYILAVRNYKDPSIERLSWIVDNLVKAAGNRVEHSRLERELAVFNRLIKRIG